MLAVLALAQRGVVVAEDADRMLAGLPAVFGNRDETGDLTRLLGVLEAVFFSGAAVEGRKVPGLEQYIDEIPALFLPLGLQLDGGKLWQTPDRFLHWLAAWLSFTPHVLFSAASLRRIVAGIVPLYGLRGTKDYLVRLLELCFGHEVVHVYVDDRPRVGFTIGESRLGIDTRLAFSRPFCFKVAIEIRGSIVDPAAIHEIEALRQRLHCVIDFAKPAHTTYELELHSRPQGEHRTDDSPEPARRSRPPATTVTRRSGD